MPQQRPQWILPRFQDLFGSRLPRGLGLRVVPCPMPSTSAKLLQKATLLLDHLQHQVFLCLQVEAQEREHVTYGQGDSERFSDGWCMVLSSPQFCCKAAIASSRSSYKIVASYGWQNCTVGWCLSWISYQCWIWLAIDQQPKTSKRKLQYGGFLNRGTPQSSILVVFSFLNQPFRGTPIYGNLHNILAKSESIDALRKRREMFPAFTHSAPPCSNRIIGGTVSVPAASVRWSRQVRTKKGKTPGFLAPEDEKNSTSNSVAEGVVTTYATLVTFDVDPCVIPSTWSWTWNDWTLLLFCYPESVARLPSWGKHPAGQRNWWDEWLVSENVSYKPQDSFYDIEIIESHSFPNSITWTIFNLHSTESLESTHRSDSIVIPDINSWKISISGFRWILHQFANVLVSELMIGLVQKFKGKSTAKPCKVV